MPVPEHVTMKEVESSNIKRIGHDASADTLYVEFSHGGLYAYDPVDESMYQDFEGAVSLGKYFHQYIRYNKDIRTTKIGQGFAETTAGRTRDSEAAPGVSKPAPKTKKSNR